MYLYLLPCAWIEFFHFVAERQVEQKGGLGKAKPPFLVNHKIFEQFTNV